MISRLVRRTTAGSAILAAVVLLAGCGQTPESEDTDRATPERKSVILATTTSIGICSGRANCAACCLTSTIR